MKYQIVKRSIQSLIVLAGFVLVYSTVADDPLQPDLRRFISIKAESKTDRSKLTDLGMTIEFIRTDSVWGFADPTTLEKIKTSGFEIAGNFDLSTARGGHGSDDLTLGFKPDDDRFHDYEELVAELQTLQSANPDLVKIHILGQTVEGRYIPALQINTTESERNAGQSNKPGILYVGMHHAREHLSSEVPLMFAQHLLKNKGQPDIANLLASRDIWIVPMLNSDGLEHDIDGGKYKMWRKNRRRNDNGKFGVDLNRNYGFEWGTGGSSSDPGNDTYKGPTPFSEPETTAIKDFIDARSNITSLLSFHTFSELVLYPWGHKYDSIDGDDLAVFEKMARTMAAWNGYKPQQSSDLYIASGDTTDWAYGAHGIFAFTFELSPTSMWEGGFYPGAKIVERVFNDNLRPCMYMLELADNPRRALSETTPSFLENISTRREVDRFDFLNSSY